MRPTTSYPPEQRAFVEETKEHITQVREWMSEVIENIGRRIGTHDSSKLEDPEISGFIAMTEELKLSEADYPSPEYRAILKKYGPSTILPHYQANDHHPEHYCFDQGILDPEWVKAGRGIRKMSLLSLIEMLCDWKAATTRMKGGGDLLESISYNQDRFGYDDDVRAILINTARELGMIDQDDDE